MICNSCLLKIVVVLTVFFNPSSRCLCVEDDPKNVADCMLQYQKEAIEENRATCHALTDIHVMLTTSDLFGGKSVEERFNN